MLDVHKASITACVRTPGEGGEPHQQVRKFSATTRGLLQLRDWLASFAVTLVGMEATGVGRRGPKKAAVAVGHSIMVICYYILKRGEPYQELGEDYFNRRRSEETYKKRLVRLLERLGHRVVLEALPQPA